MENSILDICQNILKITDEEFEEMRDIAMGQMYYTSPLKPATQAWQNKLGEYNLKALDLLYDLKKHLETGASIRKEN